jgi:cytochrome P450
MSCSGSVVRISPNELAFNSAQAWEDIYGHRNGHLNMAKDPMHAGAVKSIRGVVSLQYEPSDASHARQRRALAYSFSSKALSEQESIIQSYCTKLVGNLNRLMKEEKKLNLCDWFNFTTFDIIGDLAFGEPFGCLDRGGSNNSFYL